MPRAGFEPWSQQQSTRPQTYALDREATGIGKEDALFRIKFVSNIF
jgi:hypothetical protein